MIARYRLVLNVPNRNRGHWTTVDLGSYKTVERALRRAERVLAKHPVEETRWAPERFPFHCSLYDAKNVSLDVRRGVNRGVLVRGVYQDDAQSARLWAPVTIVPSVGELGYTP